MWYILRQPQPQPHIDMFINIMQLFLDACHQLDFNMYLQTREKFDAVECINLKRIFAEFGQLIATGEILIMCDKISRLMHCQC